MAGIITTTLDAKTLDDLVAPPLVKTDTKPKLTEEVVSQVITLIRDSRGKKGFGKIAKEVGLDKITKKQVKVIYKKMLKKIEELTPVDKPIEVVKEVIEPVITK